MCPFREEQIDLSAIKFHLFCGWHQASACSLDCGIPKYHIQLYEQNVKLLLVNISEIPEPCTCCFCTK